MEGTLAAVQRHERVEAVKPFVLLSGTSSKHLQFAVLYIFKYGSENVLEIQPHVLCWTDMNTKTVVLSCQW